MESLSSILYSLGVAVGGVFVILVGWVAVEEFVRRKSPPTPDGCELPEGFHGCRHCAMGDVCDVKDVKPESPEDDPPVEP